MRIPIYRNNAEIATIRPQNGRLTQQLLGVNIITFSLTRAEPFEFAIGDYLTFEDERYTMNIIPAVKKYSRHRYEYELTFEAPQYQLRNAQYLFWGADDDLARNGMADFSLVGTPRDFASLAVANANRIGGSWRLGRCVEAEAREVAFNGDNCLSVLQRLAQEFDTEFYFEGSTLHFERKTAALPYVFMYGKGNTLYDIERVMKDVNICTRLFAFGSERNLPFGYRNGAPRLKTGNGHCYYEQNTGLFGVIEHTQVFDDVYPHREGAVTGVDATNPLTFTDANMPFDLSERNTDGSASAYKHLLPGAKAKVKFNTGDLAGYEFELAAYLHSARKFTITPVNEKFGNPDASLPGAFALPNNALKPRVGDKYVLFDISLPQPYVDAAEEELRQKALEYLGENSAPQTEYRVTPNEIEFTRNEIKLELGATVRLIDEPLGIDKQIRIVGFERSLDNIYRYANVALADAPANALAERKYAAYVRQKQLDGSANLAAIANRRSSVIEDITANYTTDINGGLILTTLIQMRGLESDGSLKTNAGVSGLTNEANPVRFWAGADFDGRDDAPFRVRHDGSTVLTFVTINSRAEDTSTMIVGDGVISTRDDDGNPGVKIWNEHKRPNPTALNGYNKGRINLKSAFGGSYSLSETEIDIVDGEISIGRKRKLGGEETGKLSGDSLTLSSGSSSLTLSSSHIELGDNVYMDNAGAIVLKNLPTSAYGLASGNLYRTAAGVLCVVV